MKAYLFLWTFLTTVPSIGQQLNPSANEVKSYHLSLQLRLDSARSLIRASESNPYMGYVLNLTNVAELLITESHTTYHRYKDTYDSIYSAVDKQAEEPYRSFYLVEMQTSWSLVYAKFGEEWNAGWSLRSAYKKASSTYKDYPEFTPIRKSLGLLEVLIGSVPDKYNWVLKLMGMHGNISSGMEHLQSVGSSDQLLSFEARGITAVLYSYLLHKESQASAILTKMRDEDERNLLVHYLLISSLMKDHKGTQALKESKSFLITNDYISLPFLLYLKGELYMQRTEYDKAIRQYQLFIKTHHGDNYLKDAKYKIFLAYWLKGEQTQADLYHDLAEKQSGDRVEADKHAARRLGEEEYPNREIMKIRLYTDGGYYEEADSIVNLVLKNPNLPDPRDNAELIYRRARILHMTGDIDQAISVYEQVIESSQSESWYFGPNSALQLGYIYEERGNNDEAARYFKMAREFPRHEYSNSINNKAKAGLRRVEN